MNPLLINKAKELVMTLPFDRTKRVMNDNGDATNYVAYKDHRGNCYVVAERNEELPQVDYIYNGRPAYCVHLVKAYERDENWANF